MAPPDSNAPDPLAFVERVRSTLLGRKQTQKPFFLLFACLLVIGAGNSMLLAVAPPLVRQLNLADSSVGWIFSLSALLWVFASPFWGRFSDRAGRKPVIAMGLAGYALSMASFAGMILLGLNGVLVGLYLFWALTLSRSIFGILGSAASPAAQAYIADRTSASERTEQLAGLTAAFALGQAFGPAICAAIAAKMGLVFPIAMVAVLAGIASVAIWRWLPESTRPQSERRSDWRQSLSLLNDRRISAYLLYGFALSVVAGVTVQIFGLFVMDRLNVQGEAGAELAAAGFMVNALALLATQMAILPRLQLGPRGLMTWGAGLIALGVLIQIFATSLAAFLVAQAVQGLGFGLARPGFTGGASLAVRPEEQGASAGLVVAANGAGFVFSPLIGGVAYEMLGMNTPLYFTLALLAAMLVFTRLSRRLRTPITQPPPAEPTQP